MKTYKQIISEVAEPLGGDEKRFKAKHVIQKINLDAAEDGQFTGGTSAKKDKSKKASYKEGEDEAVYEETDKEDDMCPECGESYDECECDGEEMEEAKMSDADMKQRENIVKGMKKSKADLQARYGDKWKSVMYATATKKAMEAVELDEISKDLAKSYYRKATKDIGPRAGSAQGSRDDAYRSRRRARDNYQVFSVGTRKTTDDDKAAHNARADRAISNAKNQERKIKNRAVGMSRASARMESVELDEAVNVKAIQKAVDDGKSMDVIMTMFANKKTTNTDEIRKIVKDHMWKKRMKKEAVELDEISQETLRQYHGKAGADLRAKRDKLEKGTLTMKDVKQGQNRVKGLNRAANKMESVELEEISRDLAARAAHGFADKGDRALKNKDSREYKRSERGRKMAVDKATGYAKVNAVPRRVKLPEAVELDEARSLAKKDGYEFFNNDKDESVEVKYKNKIISTGDFDRGADGWFLNIKGQRGQKFFREPVDVVNFFSKNNIKEAVELDEAFKAGEMKLSDGSSVKLTNEDVSALNTLFKELNSANQKKMQERMMKDKKGFAEIVSFAKEAL